MAESKEFIAFVNRLKTLSPTITEEQRIGLLRQGVQEYSLTPDEADNILKTSGLIVGEQDSYFDVLGISIEELENLSEADIVAYVESIHDKLYRTSLNAGGRPRSDGRSEVEWRNLLNQARNILGDKEKRNEYISALLQEESEEFTTPKTPTIPTTEPNSIQTSEIVSEPSSHIITDPDDIEIPSEMVLIPSGEFMMGSRSEEINRSDLSLQRLFVNGYLIDKYPVTNSEFRVFLTENEQWQKNYIPEKLHNGKYLSSWNGNIYPRNKDNYPVVNVSWYAAMAYAQWIEKRLPTDIEWEKAARGGLTEKKYPWGNDISNNHANYGMVNRNTTPVGNYPPNEYGVYDMGGNVWEWCLNQFQHFESFSKLNISVQEIGEIIESYLEIESNRVLRGGSWASSERALNVAYRGSAAPDCTYYSYGFRCVKDIHG